MEEGGRDQGREEEGGREEGEMEERGREEGGGREGGRDCLLQYHFSLPSSVFSKDDVHKYPSSSHYTRNWDKLVAEVKQEEKDEKLEGDAALNKLFQQIYSDGSDEVKKAMNKSFVSYSTRIMKPQLTS